MGLSSGNTTVDPFCRSVNMEKRCLVTDWGEGWNERERVCVVGPCHLNQSHLF
ncbi:hypothetical protein Hanom_Chr14g01303421 [Helianthus anomalus]